MDDFIITHLENIYDLKHKKRQTHKNMFSKIHVYVDALHVYPKTNQGRLQWELNNWDQTGPWTATF